MPSESLPPVPADPSQIRRRSPNSALSGFGPPFAASELGPRGMLKIERLNVFTAALGARGYGKSTILAIGAEEIASEIPCYVVGHSLGARFPDELPDGTKLPITYYETIEKMERGLRRSPQRWHILASGSADEVLLFARRLSIEVRKRAWNEAGKLERWGPHKKMAGIEAPAIVVLVDEGIAVDAAAGKAQAKAEHRWFQELMFSLRHEHIALFYSIQNPSARSWLILDQANRIHVFHTRHRWAQEAARAAGATDQDVERMPTLGVGESILIE
jgi:hypothetical protein